MLDITSLETTDNSKSKVFLDLESALILALLFTDVKSNEKLDRKFDEAGRFEKEADSESARF